MQFSTEIPHFSIFRTLLYLKKTRNVYYKCMTALMTPTPCGLYALSFSRLKSGIRFQYNKALQKLSSCKCKIRTVFNTRGQNPRKYFDCFSKLRLPKLSQNITMNSLIFIRSSAVKGLFHINAPCSDHFL